MVRWQQPKHLKNYRFQQIWTNPEIRGKKQPTTIWYTDARCLHHKRSNILVMEQRTRTTCAFQHIDASKHQEQHLRQTTYNITDHEPILCHLTWFREWPKRNITFLAMTATQNHRHNRVKQQPLQGFCKMKRERRPKKTHKRLRKMGRSKTHHHMFEAALSYLSGGLMVTRLLRSITPA